MQSPEEHEFSKKTLEATLACCPVWPKAPELGIGPFLA